MTDLLTENVAKFLEENPDFRIVADYLALPPDEDELEAEFPDCDKQVLERTFAVVKSVPVIITRGTIYAKARRCGSDNKFASMVALQRTPGAMTDDVFFSGIPSLADQMGSKKRLDALVASCKKAGFTPNPTDVYQSGLARFPNDPQAVVSRSQGRGYIRRLCEERGWACEGGVNVKHRQPEHDPLDPKYCKPMGEDLIRSNARRMAEKDPSIKRLKPQEIREKVLEAHGPKH